MLKNVYSSLEDFFFLKNLDAMTPPFRRIDNEGIIIKGKGVCE